ncbi:uncharacterized protein LOC142538598 [Primulina tabacum]|uniref:uncharacterized protein LOC142538598 n=1 Tax=Primulina tabacum TaxID=48773 RepID=UPI003F5A7410
MPFGLKNAGATYQRLMNKVFEKQLGRNVKVYVDDILGKSTEVFGFISDLEENFATLMQYEIKLNPAKCIFGVKSGKFLGFVVTDRGIEGPELRHSKVEKIALVLVMTARKLRSYFLSHQIIVLTNSPLERIMTHSEVFGRMIKWKVELGEYDIEYRPRVAIKAQALSDFLSEMLQPDEEHVWRVFVDEASSLSGCGVGVVIIAPPGEKIKLAVRIDSRVTNNEAEYETIKGIYEAKDDMMIKYLKIIQSQAEVFVDWSIKKIPRDENGEANALVKMAASLSEWGMDIVGRFPVARAQKKFLLVAVDYFSKWVEVEPLAKITEQKFLKFLWKSIVCRFGVRRRLISDNERQFQGKKITAWCQ